MDITPTVLGAVGNEPSSQRGREPAALRQQSHAAKHVLQSHGRQAPQLQGWGPFGLRTSGRQVPGGCHPDEEYLFNLRTDRAESTNIATEQWDTVLKAREVVQKRRLHARKCCSGWSG